jgi:short chain dehydrogenase
MKNTDKEFQNKIAIITGGGTGIGKETTRALLAQGARVVINGRRENILLETEKELDPTGKTIAHVAGDAAQKATAEKLTATAVKYFGGVDILVNNAGVFKPKPFPGTYRGGFRRLFECGGESSVSCSAGGDSANAETRRRQYRKCRFDVGTDRGGRDAIQRLFRWEGWFARSHSKPGDRVLWEPNSGQCGSASSR